MCKEIKQKWRRKDLEGKQIVKKEGKIWWRGKRKRWRQGARERIGWWEKEEGTDAKETWTDGEKPGHRGSSGGEGEGERGR
jgi:hypothetical protein